MTRAPAQGAHLRILGTAARTGTAARAGMAARTAIGVAVIGTVAATAVATLAPPAAGAAEPAARGSARVAVGAAPSGAADPARAVQRIRWHRCADPDLAHAAARCGMLSVPLDYDAPNGRRIRIAVSQVRHTAPRSQYRGVMVANPGGPGGSGLWLALMGRYLPAKVAAAYDWVGFDPRGVGQSRPALTCDRTYFGFNRPGYDPTPANTRAWLRRTERYAEDCRRNGALLNNMTTVDNARDLDQLRRSLGAAKLNYYGMSYGTYLGQVYATRYPHRVRRMVLDGNIDPARVFYQSNLDQNVAMDRVLRTWFRWIARYDDVYHLGQTGAAVQQRYRGIAQQLEQTPAGGKIGSAEWLDLFGPAGYSAAAWPRFARMFADFAATGRAQPLIAAYRNTDQFHSDNSYAVYLAVSCTDAPWPAAWSTWQRDNERVAVQAPITTWLNAWFNAPCRTWPAPSRRRFQVEGGRVEGGPLLVNSTLDGATPFAGGLAVRARFPHSALLAIDGEVTHANSLSGNPCVTRTLRRYLLQGNLPRRLSGTRADAHCAADPLPVPLG